MDVVIILKLWFLLLEYGMIPEAAGSIQHLMWALLFMRVYPKEGVSDWSSCRTNAKRSSGPRFKTRALRFKVVADLV